MTQTASTLAEQRAYLLKIKNDLIAQPDKPNFDDCSKNEQNAVNLIVRLAETPRVTPRAMANMFKKYEKVLKRLLADPTSEPEIETDSDEATMPPLPSGVALPPELSKGACRWIDEYIAFSKKWSPRGFANFHEACGWSMLSMIAKRRVVLHLGKPRYTPLFIAIVAKTSMSAKSEAAGVYLSVLRKAGLEWMRGADSMTPQAMVGDMAIGKIPANYNELSEEDQAIERRTLAYKGQRGWFYEEFGQHMDAMMQKSGGPMSEFKGLIRRMDDCYPDYTRLTVQHKNQKIELPYLSLLACMTIFDMKPHAGAGSALWGDGFLARFICITPDEKNRSRDRFPEGNLEASIPSSLTAPLQYWHQRLGTREVTVESKYNEKKYEYTYSVEYGDFPEQECTLGTGVADAFYNYNNALLDMVEEQQMEQLAGNYARLHMLALRIAMLCASLENDGRIEMRHWARGQEFAEKARKGLHAMCAALNENGYAQEQRRLEEEIIKYVAEKETWLTVRLMLKNRFKNIGKEQKEQFEYTVKDLVKSGVLVDKKEGKAEYYTVPGKEDRGLPDVYNGGGK
jgi:hypothetical protein